MSESNEQGQLTRQGLLETIRTLAKETDREAAHTVLDKALLSYINDPEITQAVKSQVFWVA